MKIKMVGKRTAKTPEDFHALGRQLDLEVKALDPKRPATGVLKFRAWDDLERWEKNRLIERAHRMRSE